MSNFLPQILVPTYIDFSKLRQEYAKICLEIGFGDGEYLIDNAIKHPGNLYIGCEPYLNGVAILLRKIKEKNLANIMVFTDDTRLLLDKLPEQSLDEIHVICPDPWPKRRQQKRRLINSAFVRLLHDKLITLGKLIIATDHHEYAKHILECLKESESFQIGSEDLIYYRNLPEVWLYTKYQRKGLEKNHNVFYFYLKK